MFNNIKLQVYTHFTQVVMNDNSGRFRGGGALGKKKTVNGPINGKLLALPPPTDESRRVYGEDGKMNRVRRVGCMERPRENSATTPPPTESRRRLGTSHERGRPLRKILDLRLDNVQLCRCDLQLRNKYFVTDIAFRYVAHCRPYSLHGWGQKLFNQLPFH